MSPLVYTCAGWLVLTNLLSTQGSKASFNSLTLVNNKEYFGLLLFCYCCCFIGGRFIQIVYSDFLSEFIVSQTFNLYCIQLNPLIVE